MKCPKCGYNSFEYHNSCKKCSADFTGYKQTFNITPIIFPPEARESVADEFRGASFAEELPVESVETNDDVFSFDPPEDEAPALPSSPPSARNDDPFNFDDLSEDAPLQPPTAPVAELQNVDPFNFDVDLPEAVPPQGKVADAGFGDALESALQAGDDPFASFAFSPDPPAETEAAKPAAGEFDLNDFSWDDSKEAASDESVEEAANDDFDSIFGDKGNGADK